MSERISVDPTSAMPPFEQVRSQLAQQINDMIRETVGE
jgi:hypothetical protein